MRLLFVSNQFPPNSNGGYEQWCEEVATALWARGHTLAVLTSHSPQGADAGEPHPFEVRRALHLELKDGLGKTIVRLLSARRRLELENVRATARFIREFEPDAVLIWGMWNVPRSVPQEIERLLPGRVAYYFCDYWATLPNAYVQRWQEPARRRSMHLFKAAMGQVFLPIANGRGHNAAPALTFAVPICVSAAVRRILVERGVPVSHAKVVYGGTTCPPVSAEELAEAVAGQRAAPGLSLLYLGRLERIKGVHTVVEAMQQLQPHGQSITLDIYGGGDPDYETKLREEVAANQLDGFVRFCGSVDRAQVPTLLGAYDALVFASEWEEPFARSVLEAMAAGLAVVGTTTGGTGELLIEGETGLTFTPGDASALARQVMRLACDPALRRDLAARGRQRVVQDFTLQRMVDELETELQTLTNASQPTLGQGVVH